MNKNIIATDDAPKAIGAYSQAVKISATEFVFISGQLGLNPNTMKLVSGGVKVEAEQALKNMGAILKAAGGNFSSVIKATIYLADIKDFPIVNEVYAGFFKSDPPARAAFAVGALPLGGLVEIEAVAAL